jgi:hypothetical protein
MPDSQGSPGFSSVERKEAQSGNVSYGSPIVLHETSRSRVTFVPFYIPRSDGTDLAIKLTTYRKDASGWVLAEEKSTSLQEAAARRLLRALRDNLAVADDGENDGSYLVVRVSEGTAALGEHDPEIVAKALVKVLGQPEIVEHLQGMELTDELVTAFRGAIRLREMQTAVAQLRDLLDQSKEVDELHYQKWCEEHSWAFGNAYVMRDDVRNISAGDKLDVLLPTVISGYRDIVELKRPDMPVLHLDDAHRNFYFSSEVSKAIGQCHRYLDVLHEVAADGLRDHPEVVAYHPRAIIVLGRSKDWPQDKLKALHGLNRRLSGVTVMTYDQLLAQGERLIEMLSPPSASETEAALDELTTLDPDDVF